MLFGKSQYSLSASYEAPFFPVPPPPPQDNTIYSCWYDCGRCNDIPLLKTHPWRSVRGAALAVDFCMKPAAICDRITYKICCCSNSENWDCASSQNECVFCALMAVGLNLPKIPCCVFATASGLVVGTFGAIGDGINYCFSPSRETMDESTRLLNSEAKHHTTLAPAADEENRPLLSTKNIIEQIETWIKNDDLAGALNFFKLDERFELMQMSELYPKKVFLICLAIRNADETIDLKTRVTFILSLLDREIINGYHSNEGWITAPLLEAVRSTYRNASELLELLCVYGADVNKACGFKKPDEIPNFILLWVYVTLAANYDEEMFYKATLLLNYARKLPIEVQSFLEEKPNRHLTELHNKVKEGTEIGINRLEKRDRMQNIFNGKLSREILLVIYQYSGLFSPNYLDSNEITKTKPVYKLSDIIASHSPIFTSSETKKIGLDKYNPLPKEERLFPAFSTNTGSSNFLPGPP